MHTDDGIDPLDMLTRLVRQVLAAPAGGGLSGAQRELLGQCAERAGALAAERRRLWREKAEEAQEIRLLGEMLDAVAAATSLEGVVEATGHGIKDLLPHQRWSGARLALLVDGGRSVEMHDLGNAPIDSYWRNVRSGALAAAHDLGVELEVRLAYEEDQAMHFEEGLRPGVDGVAVAPADAAALEPLIRRARRAGIPVIAFDTPPAEDSEALLYIGTDNVAAGRLAGETITRLLPGGGAVAVLVRSTRSRNGRLRLQGLREALAGRGIEILTVLEDGRGTIDGRALATAFLKERPDVAGAVGIFDDNGPTWAAAAERVGRARELKIIGFDLNGDTMAMLMQGEIHATVAQHERDMGYQSVEVLARMAAVGLARALEELPPGRSFDTKAEVVTLEPTSWSTALADHLMKLSMGRRTLAGGSATRGGRPLRFLMIGMASRAGRPDVRREPFRKASLLAEVMRIQESLVMDAQDATCDGLEDVVALRRRGARTVVAAPLLARGAPLGAIVLSSEQGVMSSATDLLRIERVTRAAAIALQNNQLLGQLTARSDALLRAAEDQATLLETQAGLLRTIEQMSTPVMPIAPGALVLPLVGSLDDGRCARFLEVLLQEIADHDARVVIIDVTGAVGIDAGAAAHLMKAAQAARLLGAEVVLVGVGAAAARSMVELGLDLGDIDTRSTLQEGLALALARLGGRLVVPR